MTNYKERQAIRLLNRWKQNPVAAIESLFECKLDKQQKEFIIAACKHRARVAVKSCQGAGKTTCLVMLTFFFLLTRNKCRILITAPSSNQLHRVFHNEILMWHDRMIFPFKDFFDVKKETLSIIGKPYQLASLVTGSPNNLQNLAGGHSDNYIVMIDEANAIAKDVHETLVGTLGTGNSVMLQAANPIQNKGDFYEIFRTENKVWKRITFDAFGSSHISSDWIKEMEITYGKDSDVYRIRVLGEFGIFGESSFFNRRIIEEAVNRELPYEYYCKFPIVVGADVARFGDDKTVFTLRQGPKLLDITIYEQLDTMEVVRKLVEYNGLYKPDKIFIDAIGIGAGVYDRALEVGLPVIEVVVSQKAFDSKTYANLRSELYGAVKDWLEDADIPDTKELAEQLSNATFTYNNRMLIALLGKKLMKAAGLVSPDIIDSLALTKYQEVTGYLRRNKSKVRRVIRNNFLW